MQTLDRRRPLPAVEFLKIPEEGEPYLEGRRCARCGEVYLGGPVACPRCTAREPMEAVRLSNHGRLYSYCIVHRSFPGVAVPYVSAIVDLEGGGTLKGNLIEIEPDPAKIRFDLPVEVVYGDALGRRDKDGNAYLSYFFRPRI